MLPRKRSRTSVILSRGDTNVDILNNTNTILGIITGCVTIISTIIGVTRSFYKTQTEIQKGNIPVRPGFTPGCLDLIMALATAMFTCFVCLFVFGGFSFFIISATYMFVSESLLRTIATLFIICFFGFITVAFSLYNARSVIRREYQ
jgi:hypothetical protein